MVRDVSFFVKGLSGFDHNRWTEQILYEHFETQLQLGKERDIEGKFCRLPWEASLHSFYRV